MDEEREELRGAGAVEFASAVDRIGRFYDENARAFQNVYGDVIQAFRTIDAEDILEYEARSMALRDGMLLLDAGCGVCGPALYFARTRHVRIDAITASATQCEIAERRIGEAGLVERVSILQGDFHELERYYSPNAYDVVYFLESFGHSHDKERAIAAAWEVLKPGGRLYIKDLFVKEPVVAGHAAAIEENIRRINQAYRYHVGDLYAVLRHVRRRGFILSVLKTVDIPLEQFENLTISNEFQELTGIHRIEDLQSYIFPVDFFELTCIKPWHDPGAGSHRYFLQNLYALQVDGLSEDEL